MPLGRKSWEGLGERGSASQENCLFESHRYYLRAMGRGLHLFFVMRAVVIPGHLVGNFL